MAYFTSEPNTRAHSAALTRVYGPCAIRSEKVSGAAVSSRAAKTKYADSSAARQKPADFYRRMTYCNATARTVVSNVERYAAAGGEEIFEI